MKHVFSVLFSFVFLSCATSLLAFDLASVEKPMQFQTRWIARALQHNGMPLQVMSMRTHQSVQLVTTAFAQCWQQADYFIRQEQAAGWQLLSAIVDNHSIVLQLREDNGVTHAYLSAVPLDTLPSSQPYERQFPRPSGTHLLSSTYSKDGGDNATTLILSNKQSLRVNRDYYRRVLSAGGWQIELDRNFNDTISFLTRNRRSALELVLRYQQGQTYLFANIRHQAGENDGQ